MKFSQILLGHKVLGYEVLHQSGKALPYCCSWSCRPEKAMVTHSSTLAWKIPWMEEPGRLQSMGSRTFGHDWAISLSCVGEGNGNPLQCSCLENPRDGGAWWAAIHGVTQSQTWLKRLSSSSNSRRHQGYGENVRFLRKFLSAQLLFYFRKGLIIYVNPFTRCSPS